MCLNLDVFKAYQVYMTLLILCFTDAVVTDVTLKEIASMVVDFASMQ